MEQNEQAEILIERSRVLAEEILEDARKKAARILKKAEKEAGASVKKADSECLRLSEGIRQEAASRAAVESNKIRAGAGLECKRLRLARISALLEEVAEEGLCALESLSGVEAENMLKKQLTPALRQAESDTAVLVLAAEADETVLLKYAASERPDLELSVRRDSSLFPAEFILEEEDGRISYPAVFRNMYALNRECCLRAIYGVLFGGEE